jgi:hypothetical protein
MEWLWKTEAMMAESEIDEGFIQLLRNFKAAGLDIEGIIACLKKQSE